MRLVITHLLQLFLGAFDHRRALVRPYRRDAFTQLSNHAGVVDHDLLSLCRAKKIKFLQHFFRCPEIKRRLFVSISVVLPRLNYAAVHLIFRIQKMHIAGSADRLAILFAKRNDPAHKAAQILFRIPLAIPFSAEHEGIIHDRLDLEIVVKIDKSRDFLIRGICHDRPV